MRCLFIDAMGTLVRLQDPVAPLIDGLRERLGVTVSPQHARVGLRAEIAYYRAHMLDGSDAERVTGLHRACAAVLRDALGLDADLAAVTEVLLSSLRFSAFADAEPALVRARSAGARVVVVSNWDASLPDVITRVGLAELVDDVVSSAAVGAAKPDLRIFERALALAGVPAADCVHVGDSLAEDVVGARAAGIRAILLDRAGGAGTDPAAPVCVIDSLDDLVLCGR